MPIVSIHPSNITQTQQKHICIYMWYMYVTATQKEGVIHWRIWREKEEEVWRIYFIMTKVKNKRKLEITVILICFVLFSRKGCLCCSGHPGTHSADWLHIRRSAYFHILSAGIRDMHHQQPVNWCNNSS